MNVLPSRENSGSAPKAAGCAGLIPKLNGFIAVRLVPKMPVI
jgi:hypothetical protein